MFATPATSWWLAGSRKIKDGTMRLSPVLQIRMPFRFSLLLHKKNAPWGTVSLSSTRWVYVLPFNRFFAGPPGTFDSCLTSAGSWSLWEVIYWHLTICFPSRSSYCDVVALVGDERPFGPKSHAPKIKEKWLSNIIFQRTSLWLRWCSF